MKQTSVPHLTFLVCGVQKAGTTALDHYLRRHADVLMPCTKELHFFDREDFSWTDPPYRLLHDSFEPRPEPAVAVGEVTPIYCYWPDALERIARYRPSARIVICLRHPAYRAYAHWRMEVHRGGESLPFASAIGPLGRGRVAAAPRGVHRVYSYVERGFYAAQLRRAMDLFGRANVLVLRTDDLWLQPDAQLDRLARFLGIRQFEKVGIPTYIAPETMARGMTPEIEFAHLMQLYEDDIRECEALSGLQLTDWLAPLYREPMHVEPR